LKASSVRSHGGGARKKPGEEKTDASVPVT